MVNVVVGTYLKASTGTVTLARSRIRLLLLAEKKLSCHNCYLAFDFRHFTILIVPELVAFGSSKVGVVQQRRILQLHHKLAPPLWSFVKICSVLVSPLSEQGCRPWARRHSH